MTLLNHQRPVLRHVRWALPPLVALAFFSPRVHRMP